MRRSYETIAGLQDVCKEYKVYSAFETKITRNMVFKYACEKGYANIVIYYFDHKKELLNKRLIEEGLEIAKMNGSDEIVSIYYEYTGKIWWHYGPACICWAFSIGNYWQLKCPVIYSPCNTWTRAIGLLRR